VSGNGALTRGEASRLLLLVRKEARRIEHAKADNDLHMEIMAESYGDLMKIRRKLQAITMDRGVAR